VSDLDSATDRSVSTQQRKMNKNWDALFNSVSLLPLTQIMIAMRILRKTKQATVRTEFSTGYCNFLHLNAQKNENTKSQSFSKFLLTPV